MVAPSIIVENLGKKFSKTLRGAVKYGLADSFRRLTGFGKYPNLRSGEFWALDNVSFSLQRGKALGIMGVNGSGKTTLLRILNGTYNPDKGKVTLRGRVGALIAAGAGFSPMLTGRENVYVSGSLIGIPTSEIRKRFDEIVAFAELEDFIDMPVRNYSSGMSVRLGFAVAVLGMPDILLIDEVLAVGDISFQKKCYERIYSIKEKGGTILLVSHSPGAIWSVCDYGLVLNQGSTEGLVEVEQACRDYEHYNNMRRINNKSGFDDNLSKNYESSRCGTGDAFITQLEVLNENGSKLASEIEFSQGFILRAYLSVKKPFIDGIIRISIDSEMYKCVTILDSYESSGRLLNLERGEHILDIKLTSQNLRPGTYSFTCALISKYIGVHIYLEHDMARIIIRHPKEIFLYADFRAIMHLKCSYKLIS
jgi:lipopolysaccharide transport system ATP-binding protein